jgi:copper resistance protein D
MNVWDVTILLSKSLTYLAMLTVPGVFFVIALQRRASRHVDWPADMAVRAHLLFYFLLPMLVLGILSVSVFFLAQVGAVNQQGVAGMLDQEMGAIMASTALGDGVQWRLNGFFLSTMAVGLLWLGGHLPGYQQRLERLALLLVLLATLVFAWSFAILGHTNVLSMDVRLMLGLHLIAVSVWIGALYPLYRLCSGNRDSDGAVLALLMRDFGRAGWGFVVILLLTGLYLIVALVGSWEALISSGYGRLLLLKLILVTGLLTLGSLNKFRLVPALKDTAQPEAATLRLRRSIIAEMVLAAAILLATATLTTLTGPAA